MKVFYLILLFINLFFFYYDVKALWHMLRYAYKEKHERMDNVETFFLCMSVQYFRRTALSFVLKLIVIILLVMLLMM